MKCPVDNENLEKVLFYGVEADYCPRCLGIWFDAEELCLAKDTKDIQLNWVDFDIWRDTKNFDFKRTQHACPYCRTMLMEVAYDDSKIKIDFCKHCRGIWLDRGEFKQIINYLKRKADYEILHHYTSNLGKQFWEVFSGPQKFREELADFMMLMKLFNYKFIVQHPFLNYLIDNMQK